MGVTGGIVSFLELRAAIPQWLTLNSCGLAEAMPSLGLIDAPRRPETAEVRLSKIRIIQKIMYL
jgi:hypothetical protein